MLGQPGVAPIGKGRVLEVLWLWTYGFIMFNLVPQRVSHQFVNSEALDSLLNRPENQRLARGTVVYTLFSLTGASRYLLGILTKSSVQ